MPKLKTNRSARKRFKLTKSGKVRRYRAFKGHMRQTKSAKRRRALRRPLICEPCDEKVARALIQGK
ncbi:MAG: 50S ribosomal protein L35 [Planctomycetes bacterium]|nr:50S ribosomal protein L35 [Planctomycetota bacterium]